MGKRFMQAVALAAFVALLLPTTAGAVVSRDPLQAPARQFAGDKRSHPLGDRQAELRSKAIAAELKNKADGAVYEVEPGEFVELGITGEDAVWTVPGEFADYPHNSIPEPDRDVDNSTIWVEDFSRDYYLDLLFAEGDDANSMREFFLEQSSGRYTVKGDITDWVPVPGDAVTYDDGDPGPGTATNVWQFLQDSVNGWYDMKVADGWESEDFDAYLAQFDVLDRYDYDGDGDFDEPDGYIDHFQSLHSGEGNEAGGGELGDDSIWSHSWYALYTLIGEAGPDFNQLGGIQVGQSDLWIGDYTIQPENGGVGVFTHEFTHDLGVPDLYDTSGTGENATGFWTLMSSGSWLSDSESDDIGSKPSHLGPWEKLQLGWLDYDVATAGDDVVSTLGPAEYNNTKAQALVVTLPDKLVEQNIGEAYAGDYFYYSGAGDNLDNYMYRAFDLDAGSSLTAQVSYQIESNWDYAYVVVSENGGLTWDSVETNLSTTTDPNGQNFGFGITGSTRKWTELNADLSAYEGDVLLGFRYWTDGALTEPGFMADDIVVTGYAIDGAEAITGWTFDGFKRTTGFETGYYNNYYLAEFRQYWGYDETLNNAYNFGFQKGRYAAVNLVEHFPYQDGLLVWYCDDSQSDNNTGVHPGSGFALPVDAHPEPLLLPNKKVWRNRVQTYDATFGFAPTDALVLHDNSRESLIPSLAGVSVFDDTQSYWREANPTASVITPKTGTKIEILGLSDNGMYMDVRVAPVE